MARLLPAVLICLMGTAYGSSTLCQNDKFSNDIKCKCSEENRNIYINVAHIAQFKNATSISISDCRTVELQTILEFIYNLKTLVLERIELLHIRSSPLQGFQNLIIKDVRIIKEIPITILNRKPNLKEFVIRNSVLEKLHMDMFIGVTRQKVIFDRVTFLNISYDDTAQANAAPVHSVTFIGCYFMSPIPSFALQFNASGFYQILNSRFDGTVHPDAIIAKTPKIHILGNKFYDLQEKAISLHHYNNYQSLQLYLVNNTILSMDKDAIYFQQNLKHDKSVIKGNKIPCATAPQCDERAVWFLRNMKYVMQQIPNDFLFCDMLTLNECLYVEDNTTESLLAAMTIQECSPVLDAEFQEDTRDQCSEDIKEFLSQLPTESGANGNKITALALVMCIVMLL